MINITVKRKYKPPTAQVVKRKKRVSLREFSKIVIAALTVAWFIGLAVGVAVVVVQLVRNDMTVGLSDLLMYIGAPMTGGIVSYMLKSAYENKEKIKGAHAPEDEVL